MKLRPLGDRVVVKAAPHEEKTKGGIVLPDTVKEKPIEGIVVAVGPGKLNDDGTRTPIDLKPDDKVIYSKYSGTEIKLDGEDELLVISERDILAIIEK